MRFDISIWMGSRSLEPDIRTWIDVSDPTSAALTVMAQLGLCSAFNVAVFSGCSLVGSFANLDLSSVPSFLTDCAVSYDYGM